jgi:large subunit ribosomal protein L4
MQLQVKNIDGKSSGTIDLDDAVFGAEVHEHMLWEVVKWQLARRRAGTHFTKRIGEVRGSAKKVWKQKGTGQARQGSKRAPHWVGGSSVFGPRPRDYDYRLPRRSKRIALRAALSLRAGEQKLVVVEDWKSDGKTKSVATALAALGAPQPSSKVLIVDSKDNVLLARGTRNLASSQWIAPEGLNVYDLLRHQTVVFTRSAVKQVEEALKGD